MDIYIHKKSIYQGLPGPIQEYTSWESPEKNSIFTKKLGYRIHFLLGFCFNYTELFGYTK